MKVKCDFNGEIIECKVVENIGYQGGYFVKAVEYNNTERIVVKRGGNIYTPHKPTNQNKRNENSD